MKNKNFSIKAKLLLAIIPITCAMIVALVIIAYNVSAMMIKQNATQLLETSVAKQGTSIENWMNENLSSFNAAKRAIEQAHPKDAELQKIQTRMKEINITAEKRAQIENEIKNATAMQNDSQKLQSLKNINTEITAMGKNAMSLGSMLQTAYEKFANKIATLYRNVY